MVTDKRKIEKVFLIISKNRNSVFVMEHEYDISDLPYDSYWAIQVEAQSMRVTRNYGYTEVEWENE